MQSTLCRTPDAATLGAASMFWLIYSGGGVVSHSGVLSSREQDFERKPEGFFKSSILTIR
jgi:hypothetical protein